MRLESSTGICSICNHCKQGLSAVGSILNMGTWHHRDPRKLCSPTPPSPMIKRPSSLASLVIVKLWHNALKESDQKQGGWSYTTSWGPCDDTAREFFIKLKGHFCKILDGACAPLPMIHGSYISEKLERKNISGTFSQHLQNYPVLLQDIFLC